MDLHTSLHGIQEAMDLRCVEWLETLSAALTQAKFDAHHGWFDKHYLLLGAEIYVALWLARDGFLRENIEGKLRDAIDPAATATDLDEILGVIQARSCMEMCARWGQFRFNGERLQDCIDAIVYPGAVSKAAPKIFERLLVGMITEDISTPLQAALEATHAWLCQCAEVENVRADSYTRAMFQLEILATEAGGSLPLLAHACRQDSDRLKATINLQALEAEILHASGPSIDGLIETARRLGHPNAAKSLPRKELPNWIPKLKSPGIVGHMIMCGSDGEIMAAQELTPDNVLRPLEGLLSQVDVNEENEADSHDIFISYSSRDRLKADAIARYLRNCGLTVFMDHHTAAGDLWTRRISDRLFRSKLVLVL